MLPPDGLTHPRRTTGEALSRCGILLAVVGEGLAGFAMIRLVQLEGPTEGVLGLAWLIITAGGRHLRLKGRHRSTAEFYEAQRRPLGPEYSGF